MDEKDNRQDTGTNREQTVTDFHADTPKPTREEFTAAAAQNLVKASEDVKNSLYAALPEEDDFIADPFLERAERKKKNDTAKDDKPLKKKKKKNAKKIIKNHKRGIKAAVKAACALFSVCLVIYIYGCITAPTDRMGRNLYIENVNVSNMTYAEALAAVGSEPLLATQNITVVCGGHQYEINGVDIGLSARFEDTVDKAMRYGKTNSRLINGLANALQIFKKHTVVPHANVNEDILRQKLAEFGVQVFGELAEHQLEIGDDVLICTPGHSGFDNNTDTACEEVLQAINSKEKFKNITVSLKLGAPKTLTAEDIDNFVYLEPQNAYYAYADGGITIVPEVTGRIIDKAEAGELAAQIVEGGEVIYIPFISTPAEVTAEILQAKLFNATIGSYSTSYGTSNANRCANIANAASRINGKILMPGEVFSFNATVGPRSVANGFHLAKEYANGETVDGIGGGTCQVSSTLYNACIYADLSIISRTNHMFPVGYCPLGQDATVADSGVDYKFVNSMDYPIKISAVTGGYTITVSIIGTQRDVPRTVKVVNSTSHVGADTRVVTTRKVYNSAGELISTDQLPGSYYKPHD